ncbi:hypothetical protein MMC18_009513 [Xylographa bjoerkii]|nr:hypothetical protein [Xylographa bjoerkii]
MRQLLRVLVKLLLVDLSGESSALVVHGTVKSCLSHISTKEDSSYVKAAMTVITMFLRKRLISAESLLARESTVSPKDAIENLMVQSRSDLNVRESPQDLSLTVSGFVLQLMGWMRHAETGPAAGRLIVAFFGFVDDATKLENSSTSPTSSSWVTIWVDSVLGAIHQQPELIEKFEQHLLPELVRMNLSYAEELLHTLPIEELCRGNIGCLTETDLRLCLAVLRVVEELGSSSLLDTVTNGLDLHNLSYAQRVSIELLVHRSASVRVSALRSLTYSSSSIMPLPSYLLFTLRQALPRFHAETDSAARDEFCSIIKKLFSRMKGVIYRLTRRFDDLKDAIGQPDAIIEGSYTEGSESLQNHTVFISWYMELLLKELQPTASYQRHISALKVLQLLNVSDLCSTLPDRLLNSSHSQESSQPVESYTTSFIHLLLELIMDPFDDVRNMAASLLHEHYSISLAKPTTSGTARPKVSPGIYSKLSWTYSKLELVLQRAEALSRRTGRSDYADGVGRLHDLQYSLCGKDEMPDDEICERHLLFVRLISDLEIDIQVAYDNLQTAIASVPLHGHLIALRHIVSHREFFRLSEFSSLDWRRMHIRLVHCCSMIWFAVKDVICYDSPEGHVIVEAEDDESDADVKDALSYSWRALKEASALLLAMISNPGYSPPSLEGGLAYEDLKTLGDLTITQLAELRHRGAFSTVSQTFLACCIRCTTSDDSRIAKLPSIWYKETLFYIEAKAASLTRRSAGLPAMITGILAANPHGPLFDRAILDLQKIADAPVEPKNSHTNIRLSQVHALNCLKDIFTNSRLGSSTATHLATTLVIAVNCLEKNVWAIRNCGLMLLKALLTRLMGGTGMTSRAAFEFHPRGSMSRTTYEKYPVLADLVMRLLQHQSTVDSSAEDVTANHDKLHTAPQSIQMIFPAMEIIERIGVAPSHELLVEQLLLTHLDSPVWNLRDKAAMTLSRLIEKQALFGNVYTLMQSALWQGPTPPQNALHGRLLCLKYMIEDSRNTLTDRADIKDLSNTLYELLQIKVTKNTCPVSIAALLDIESFTVERLLIGYFRDVLRLGRQFLLAKDITSIVLLSWQEGKNRDLLQMWRHTVRDLCRPSRNSSFLSTDSLISALARARVLYALLEDATSISEPTTFNVLQGLAQEGDVALSAGLQSFNSIQGMFDPVRVQPLKIYITLLQQAKTGDSQVLLMEGLSALLSSFRQSAGARELTTPRAPMSPSDERIDTLSWEEQEPMTNPETVNATLSLRGTILANACIVSFSEDSSLEERLNIWVRMLKLAGDAKSDLSTRLAAATSIYYFRSALRPGHSEPSSQPVFLGIYLALYDLLLDDDEDVRDIGALVVSWICSSSTSSPDPASTGNISLCPVVAVEKLLEFLVTAYHGSRALLHEAVSRLTGEKSTSTHDKNIVGTAFISQAELETFSSSLRDLFKTARKEDTSLFVEEKQNLYIDPVQESQRWASVLVHISLAVLQDSVASCLVEWVLAGLECLVDIADHEVGGPLGWMSKPEVFTLGIRVLEAARVVQDWQKRGLVLQSPDLEGLVTKFKRADIHPVWLLRVPGE